MTYQKIILIVFTSVFATLIAIKFSPTVLDYFEYLHLVFIILTAVFFFILGTNKVKTDTKQLYVGQRYVCKQDKDLPNPARVKIVYINYKTDDIHFIFLGNGNEKYKLTKEQFLRIYEKDKNNNK